MADSCAIHISGGMIKGSLGNAAIRKLGFRSSGGCTKAQHPNFAIMGQQHADPGRDAYRQGGGDV